MTRPLHLYTMNVGLVFLILFTFTKSVIGEEEGFIVGGDFVQNIRRYPHVAFLVLTGKDGNCYICGSSVLTQNILITAAHCLDDVTELTAYVGNVNREKGKVYPVETFKQHEQWDTVNINHDVCLCKLKKPLKLGRTIKRVILMKRPPRARQAELAGWGAVEETDYTDSMVLKHTAQKLWTHNQCKKVLRSSPKGTICGGQARSKKNFASKGDSGSGLIIRKNIIVGLVSYKDVAVSRSLVIYTDTAYFYNWITKMAKQLSCGRSKSNII